MPKLIVIEPVSLNCKSENKTTCHETPATWRFQALLCATIHDVLLHFYAYRQPNCDSDNEHYYNYLLVGLDTGISLVVRDLLA